jgi:hypothetical protein
LVLTFDFANANSNASTHTNYLDSIFKEQGPNFGQPTIIQAKRVKRTARACVVHLIGGLLKDTVPSADGHYSDD